jgi:hypothetical protein
MTSCALSEYELKRQKQIEENERFLESLNITEHINKRQKQSSTTSGKLKEQQRPGRKSTRIIDKTINHEKILQKTLTSDSINAKNVNCRYIITVHDLKHYIAQKYSDKRISNRVYHHFFTTIISTFALGY